MVSCIIPTRNRPELVTRAVKSALMQRWEPLEVIVVVDGPDDRTVQALSSIDDDRLRVEVLPESVGGGEARNIGVHLARGEWIGFLDDDDEWLPEKIYAQMRIALDWHTQRVVICPRMYVKSPKGPGRVLPQRDPDRGESISEYLLMRRKLTGETQIQTSSFLTSKALLLEIPWDNTLKKHQDLDLYLKWDAAGVDFIFIPDILSIWYVHQAQRSVSNDNDWQYSVRWAEQNAHLFKGGSLAGFIASQVAMRAFERASLRTVAGVFQALHKHGARYLDYLIALAALGVRVKQRALL